MKQSDAEIGTNPFSNSIIILIKTNRHGTGVSRRGVSRPVFAPAKTFISHSETFEVKSGQTKPRGGGGDGPARPSQSHNEKFIRRNESDGNWRSFPISDSRLPFFARAGVARPCDSGRINWESPLPAPPFRARNAIVLRTHHKRPTETPYYIRQTPHTLTTAGPDSGDI